MMMIGRGVISETYLDEDVRCLSATDGPLAVNDYDGNTGNSLRPRCFGDFEDFIF